MAHQRRTNKRNKSSMVPSTPAKDKHQTATSPPPLSLPTPGTLDTTPSNKPSNKKVSTPAHISNSSNKQVRHIFPSYKRRFRVLLAGHPESSNQQHILKHYNINLGWVNGVQIPSDLKRIAFAYFVSQELAEKAVKEWKNKDSFMFLQRVSTLYRYKIDLPFNVTNLKKVVSEVDVEQIVSMNYSPSNGFWAINVDKSLANKPTSFTEIDATKTFLRLSWDSDKKFDTGILKEIIINEWKINTPEIDAVFHTSNSGALVKVKRDELKNSSITRLIYVGDIVVTNLSFNPRLNKPSIMTRVKEMVQHMFATSNMDPKQYASSGALELLKAEVACLTASNNNLVAENLILNDRIKDLTSKLESETKQLTTKAGNVGEDIIIAKKASLITLRILLVKVP